LTPGIDWVRVMGGARETADLDLECMLDSGDEARGLKGRDGGAHEGELLGDGDVGEGSVERRRVGGLREKSPSWGFKAAIADTLRLGRGEGRNSSMRSVSGTGSMVTVGCRVLTGSGMYRWDCDGDAFGRPDLSPRVRIHGLVRRWAWERRQQTGKDATLKRRGGDSWTRGIGVVVVMVMMVVMVALQVAAWLGCVERGRVG